VILLRHVETDTFEWVPSVDGYDMAAYVRLGEVPDGTDVSRLTWNGTEIAGDLDLLRTLKSREVDAKLAQLLAAGFTPSDGPCAGKTLQTRDDTDRTNWLTAKDKWRDKREAGQGADDGAVIRTADNENVECTYDEGFATLQAMSDWGFALMGRSWALKDAIAIADADELETIDITAGWP
jgi:hypothetical protein